MARRPPVLSLRPYEREARPGTEFSGKFSVASGKCEFRIRISRGERREQLVEREPATELLRLGPEGLQPGLDLGLGGLGAVVTALRGRLAIRGPGDDALLAEPPQVALRGRLPHAGEPRDRLAVDVLARGLQVGDGLQDDRPRRVLVLLPRREACDDVSPLGLVHGAVSPLR